MKKKIFKYLLIMKLLVSMLFLFVGCKNNISQKYNEVKNKVPNEVVESEYTNPFVFLEKTYKEGESYISSGDDISLKNTDSNKKNYTFVYNNETYTAVYTKDNWHIIDSYKIRNKQDITIICGELIKEHQIHGADMKSYRSADDMADEWIYHNIAYDYLPEGNSWKKHAKDVDLNPEDQGKSIEELYNDRINKGE